jgi:hypothetical protein
MDAFARIGHALAVERLVPPKVGSTMRTRMRPGIRLLCDDMAPTLKSLLIRRFGVLSRHRAIAFTIVERRERAGHLR